MRARTPAALIPVLAMATVCLLLQLSCGVGDFDIAEVAPEEHLNTEHVHEHEQASDHVHDTGHEHDGEHEHCDAAHAHGEHPESGSEMHHHEAGARNHGTEWFFNQPWAASFIWPKMLRDSVLLAALSVIIYLASKKLTRRA